MTFKTKCAVTLLVGGLLGVGPAMADKPSWAGSGKGKSGHDNRGERHARDRDNDRADRHGKRGHFDEQHRDIARKYYAQHYGGGHCPPGLAKKRNGCMPPGQAKKWQMGRPLPREVVYYEVPRTLVMQIGAPPSGYRYVRVASDILMIAIGSGMVVDAITNLTG